MSLNLLFSLGPKCFETMKTEVMNSNIKFCGVKSSNIVKVFVYLFPCLFTQKKNFFLENVFHCDEMFS